MTRTLALAGALLVPTPPPGVPVTAPTAVVLEAPSGGVITDAVLFDRLARADVVYAGEKHDKDGEHEKKPFRFTVENGSQRELECGLFYFADDFAVHSLNTDRLPAGSKAVFFEDFFELTDGKTASQEEIKLIVSTEPLDSFLLAMEGLKVGESVSYWRSKSTRGGLDLRPGAKDQAYNAATAEDWFAVSMTVNLKGAA